MKKAALVFVVILLILSIGSTSFAIETIYRNGKSATVKHFRVYTPWCNNLENGKPLVVLLASSEQGKLENLVAAVNKYGMYDELDINLMGVAFTGTYTIGGWVTVAGELAEYLKPAYESHSFEILIDCIGNSGYGGCCLAQALADRKMLPKELNLGGGGADPQYPFHLSNKKKLIDLYIGGKIKIPKVFSLKFWGFEEPILPFLEWACSHT